MSHVCARAGPKAAGSWVTFSKRTGRKKKEKKTCSSGGRKKKVMIGKFSFAGTILEFPLPCTSQIVGNTISFLLHKFHGCGGEDSAAWKHQSFLFPDKPLSASAG